MYLIPLRQSGILVKGMGFALRHGLESHFCHLLIVRQMSRSLRLSIRLGGDSRASLQEQVVYVRMSNMQPGTNLCSVTGRPRNHTIFVSTELKTCHGKRDLSYSKHEIRMHRWKWQGESFHFNKRKTF